VSGNKVDIPGSLLIGYLFFYTVDYTINFQR
jgi:hypothetical protein